jgi:protein-L-isoaspartate(D-aspartate) O-methyltransferase
MTLSLQGMGMTSLRTRERMIKRLSEQGIQNKRVLEIMRDTPRHIFMDEALSSRAYEDTALPIGYNQTISQPYIVAKMTELLLESSGRLGNVLEI